MLFVAALIVTAEVLLRKGIGALFGVSFLFSGSDEISSYLFAVGTSWSLAYAFVTRGHVRIDVLYANFGPRARATFDLLALIGLAVFVAAMVERSWDLASSNYLQEVRSNTNLRIPLAWSQLPWFGGILLFMIAIVIAFLRSILAIVRGDFATASATAGIASQDAEIEDELRKLGIETHHAGKN